MRGDFLSNDNVTTLNAFAIVPGYVPCRRSSFALGSFPHIHTLLSLRWLSSLAKASLVKGPLGLMPGSVSALWRFREREKIKRERGGTIDGQGDEIVPGCEE